MFFRNNLQTFLTHDTPFDLKGAQEVQLDCKCFACVFGQPIEVDQDQNIGLSGQILAYTSTYTVVLFQALTKSLVNQKIEF